MANKYLDDQGLEYLLGKGIGELEKKVDKEEGKGLSGNDFTDEYKQTVDEHEDDIDILQSRMDNMQALTNLEIEELLD